VTLSTTNHRRSLCRADSYPQGRPPHPVSPWPRWPQFPKYSKELLNLVKILLAPRPEDRPLTAHILRNAFVRRKWQDLTDGPPPLPLPRRNG